ncbi:MAG: T9SS type A sorting domain-containing protein [Flavobacteriales bacterium]
MKTLILLLILSNLALAQVSNFDSYFEKFSTPLLGPSDNEYVAHCFSLIPEENGYVGNSAILTYGLELRTHVFSLKSTNNTIYWEKIIENNISGYSDINCMKKTKDGNFVVVSNQSVPLNSDDPLNYKIVISKISPNGNLIFQRKYFSNDTSDLSKCIGFEEMSDSSLIIFGPTQSGMGLLKLNSNANFIFFKKINDAVDWQTFEYKDSNLVSFVTKYFQTPNNTSTELTTCKFYLRSNTGDVLSEKWIVPDDPTHNCEYRGVRKVFKNEFVALTMDEASTNSPDATLRYIDSSLNVKWSRTFQNTVSFPKTRFVFNLTALTVDSLNQFIYVAGTIIDKGVNPAANAPWTLYCAFLTKVDYNGNIIYKKYFHFGTMNVDKLDLYIMSMCPNGDVALSGKITYLNQSSGLYSVPPIWVFRFTSDGVSDFADYLGIEETQVNQNELGVYPNPSTGIFHLESLSEEPMEVEVYDHQGSRIQLDDQFTSIILLENQAPGVYFIHVKQGDQFWVKKVVLQ